MNVQTNNIISLKPSTKLFKQVDDQAYEMAFERLLQLRKEYPSYRDDELLMFELSRLQDY